MNNNLKKCTDCLQWLEAKPNPDYNPYKGDRFIGSCGRKWRFSTCPSCLSAIRNNNHKKRMAEARQRSKEEIERIEKEIALHGKERTCSSCYKKIPIIVISAPYLSAGYKIVSDGKTWKGSRCPSCVSVYSKKFYTTETEAAKKAQEHQISLKKTEDLLQPIHAIEHAFIV